MSEDYPMDKAYKDLRGERDEALKSFSQKPSPQKPNKPDNTNIACDEETKDEETKNETAVNEKKELSSDTDSETAENATEVSAFQDSESSQTQSSVQPSVQPSVGRSRWEYFRWFAKKSTEKAIQDERATFRSFHGDFDTNVDGDHTFVSSDNENSNNPQETPVNMPKFFIDYIMEDFDINQRKNAEGNLDNQPVIGRSQRIQNLEVNTDTGQWRSDADTRVNTNAGINAGISGTYRGFWTAFNLLGRTTLRTGVTINKLWYGPWGDLSSDLCSPNEAWRSDHSVGERHLSVQERTELREEHKIDQEMREVNQENHEITEENCEITYENSTTPQEEHQTDRVEHESSEEEFDTGSELVNEMLRDERDKKRNGGNGDSTSDFNKKI